MSDLTPHPDRKGGVVGCDGAEHVADAGSFSGAEFGMGPDESCRSSWCQSSCSITSAQEGGIARIAWVVGRR
jgi:hypothetical protein